MNGSSRGRETLGTPRRLGIVTWRLDAHLVPFHSRLNLHAWLMRGDGISAPNQARRVTLRVRRVTFWQISGNGSSRQLLNTVCLVGVAAHKTNLTALVTGPVIELSERHAKTRSNR
jgi:hypothetical protein